MKSNRRSVLIGLGALTVGGGAVFGTGAFSSVEANRQVTVNVDEDDGALLALNPSGAGVDSDVVQLDDGLLVINFDEAGDSSEGVNLDAVTTVGEVDTSTSPVTVSEEAFTITNNGSNEVDITFDIDFDDDQSTLNASSESDILKLWTDPGDGSITDDNLVDGTLTLDTSESADVAIQIDTTGEDGDSVDTNNPLFDSEATIRAESTQ